jgi:hypothetical protein
MVWFTQWFERKSDEPRALIVSLDDASRGSDSAARMISWLQAGGGATDVAVFPHFGDAPRSEGDSAMERIPSPAPTKAAVLADLRRWPEWHSDWGINE